MKLLSPKDWKEYELIDCGEGEKLERFGAVITRRPESQAIWPRHLSEQEWQKMTDARFFQEGSNSGRWEKRRSLPEQWALHYQYKDMKLQFRLSLTPFKHVGIFPEQAVNWNYIYEACRTMKQPKVLNLFAYTGGASLAARVGGGDVIHCDSIKSTINWANANMQASRLGDIRWLVEDAFKFVRREAKRGNTYQGIILDPPAFGHGPKGEKWKLEDMIDELTRLLSQILDPRHHFLVFNSYSLGFSPLVISNLIHTHFGSKISQKAESGELFMRDRGGRRMSMGILVRFRS